jgi:hypothetical protein
MTATQIEEEPIVAEGDTMSAAEVWAHDRRYWIVALFLGILTAIEVSTYVAPDFWGSLATATLLILMAVKFFTVTWEFMHLRIDRVKYGSSMLTIVFYFGLILAAVVYIVALSTFRFFGD